MKQNDTVEILAVANGFVLRGVGGLARGDYGGTALLSEMIVFQSFAELIEHLTVHFTHRGYRVLTDVKRKS